MARNPDPKYGRWILPVVIAGMVGATFAFVNSLDPDTVPDSGTTLAVSTSVTSTTTVEPSVTTTTLAAEVTAYLADLEGLVVEAEGLLERARTINNDWDNRTATFGDTEDALRTLATDTSEFEARVLAAATVAELEASHLALNEAAAAMSGAATGMVDGLLDPDSAQGRVNSFTDYQNATTAMRTGLESVKSRAGVASDLVTEDTTAATTTTVAGG
ncbi:MAG: hypothetical protein OES13_02895 [Acidimicrobiia bacterium]|nr:hypothetical protein [Acidimicrobiia bacterium]